MPRYPKPRTPLPRRFYTIDEFADVTGQCRATVYNGMNAGRIPFVEDGGRRKIPVDFVDQQIADAMKPISARGEARRFIPDDLLSQEIV